MSQIDERLTRVLTEIGLSQNEALVYQGALEEGATSALRLARVTGIKRSTVYSVLSSLQERGLMYVETRGFKRRFVPENPERLESVLESRHRLFESVLPELSARFFQLDESDSFIRHYRGLDGIKSVYDKLLKELRPKDFYLVISDQQKWHGLDPKYFDHFISERTKLDIDLRLILQDSPNAQEDKRTAKQRSRRIKILPSQYALNTNLVVVPHKTIMVQTIEPLLAVVIENSSVVQMNRIMFEMVWDSIAN